MEIWGYKLVVTRPFLSDDTTICSSGFVFENLAVDPVAASLESGHNLVVGINVMTITHRLEGFYVDGFSAVVLGKYDVLIPTKRAHKETAHIISLEFSDMGYLDMHFVGSDGWEGFIDRGIKRCHKD